MKSILKYLLNSLLLSIAIIGNAQENSSIKKSLRVSIDLSPIVIMGFDPGRVGVATSVDYEFKKNFFAVLEGGWLNYNIDHPEYDYQINGFYALVGADYNVLKKAIRVENDIMFVGLRYGASSFNQKVENITINNYWGTYVGDIEDQQLFGQWAEITGGLKAELFFAKNIFIGWTLRTKILISGKNNEILEPFIIPGYGKTEKNFKFGISWFIAYRIPFKQ
ncbi:MAG: DUF6048 family protein [Bacteroidota bacterium]